MEKSTNTIGFGTVYKVSWCGKYVDINVIGFVNQYLFRVKIDNGIIENTKNLLDKVKKLFSI